MQRNYRRALNGALLASVSILGAGLSQGFGAVIDYPDGSTNANPIVLMDNTTQLQVLTGSATQSGVISESGGSFGFEKIGSGTLTLTGANTYAGITTIGAGSTLALGNGGFTGSVAGNIIDNGTLVLNHSSATVANTISGTGGLNSLGNNTLTAVSSYTGPTQVLAGTLSLNGLGIAIENSSAVSLSGANNASLDISAQTSDPTSIKALITCSSCTSADNGQVAGGSVILGSRTLIITAASGSYLGTISGIGGITINAGTQILAGNNTYGATIIQSAATLQIGNGGTTGTLGSGNVTDAGTLIFNNSGSTTAPGSISGAGKVSILTGKVTYGAAMSYTGGTTIKAGATLQLGTGSTAGGIVGDVANNGTLIFNRSDTINVSSVVTGSGAVVMAGSGVMSLVGANTYTGGTTVSAGTLQIGAGGTAGSIAGNVTDNGTLAFNHSDVMTFAGVISGDGSLSQVGSGTLTLTGANTYTGGTIISAGTLQIGAGGTAGSIVGNVTDNGTLAFNRSDVMTFAGVISGGGGLSQVGGGTLTLTGPNIYTGGTTIGAGTLQIGAGGMAGSITGNVTDNDTLAFNRSDVTTFSGVISGFGGITQAGSGTLILSGANSYSGATTVSAGTLNVIGSIAASSGVTVANGATLSGTGTVSSTTIQSGGTLSAGGASVGTLNVSGDLTLNSGAITQVDVATASADKLSVSGTALIDGTLNVAFASGSYTATQYALITTTGALSGTFSSLNLTGAPSGLATSLAYDANNVFLKLASGFAADSNFNIDSGTANVVGSQTTGSLSGMGGTINIGTGSLTDNQTSNSSYAGVFTGSGTLTKGGAGALILNGNSGGFTGATSVTGGLLEVGDDAHPGASLGGAVNVGAGGTLGGHGTVTGSVTNAGSTAPGGSIGTLTVAGDYSFTSGASLQQEVAASGSADLLKVGGAVNIAGNTTLQVSATDPVSSYARVTSYTIVTGAGGVRGGFATVTSPASLTSIVSYVPGAINLTLVRNDISLATLAATANQAGVGGAISADPGSTLFAAVAPLGNAQIPSVLASLSGEIHASVRSVAIEDDRILRQSVLDELMEDPQGATVVWGDLFGSSGHIDSDGNAASINHTNGGGIVGIDTMLGGLRAGVAGAYSSHSVSAADRASHASGTSGHVLAYAGWRDAALYLRAGVDFGSGREDILRNLDQLAETDTSHQNLSTTQIFGEAGYSLQAGFGALEPYVQIAWLEARSGSFAETGGALSALSGGPAKDSVAYGSFGLRARLHDFDLGDGMCLTPRLDLGLQHAFQTFRPSQTLALSGATFLINGTSLADDAAMVGAGFDLGLSPSAHLSLGYDGAVASRAINHTIRLQLGWSLQ